MNIINTWHVSSPSKGDYDVPDQGGKAIADPFFVLKGVIRAGNNEGDEGTFSVYTPALSGRVERMIIIPDHNAQPGIAGTFDLEAFQHFVEAPPIVNALPFVPPYEETLDILNLLGVAIPNNALTHFTVADYGVNSRSPMLPHLLVQDRLLLSFVNWAAEEDYDLKRLYVYLYMRCDT